MKKGGAYIGGKVTRISDLPNEDTSALPKERVARFSNLSNEDEIKGNVLIS